MAADRQNALVDPIPFLKQEFLNEARVIDAQQEYISASSFNLRMKPNVLRLAARAIVEKFSHQSVTVVHGIPHSGNYLATAVSLEFDSRGEVVRLHTSRKDQHIPSTWKDVYRKEIRSFTARVGGTDIFSGITLSFVKKGDRILIVDDVCAHGDTAYPLIQGLLEAGVEVVGFAVLFDKMSQGGLARVASLGVATFSCVQVKEIKTNDTVLLA